MNSKNTERARWMAVWLMVAFLVTAFFVGNPHFTGWFVGDGASITNLSTGFGLIDAKVWFSLKGDGVVDDSLAVQAAMDFTVTHPQGGTMHFPAGLYKITQTITNWPSQSGGPPFPGTHSTNAWIIEGDGPCTTVFDARSFSTNAAFHFGTPHSGWGFRNFSILGPHANSAIPCDLSTTDSNLSLTNSGILLGSTIDGEVLTKIPYSFSGYCQDCYFIGFGFGFHLRNTQAFRMSNIGLWGNAAGLVLYNADSFVATDIVGAQFMPGSTTVLFQGYSTSDATFINPQCDGTFLTVPGVNGWATNLLTTNIFSTPGKINVIGGDFEVAVTNGLYAIGTNCYMSIVHTGGNIDWIHNATGWPGRTNFPLFKVYTGFGCGPHKITLHNVTQPGVGQSTNTYPWVMNNDGTTVDFWLDGIPTYSYTDASSGNASWDTTVNANFHATPYIISNACTGYPTANASAPPPWTPSNIFGNGIVFWYDITGSNGLFGTTPARIQDQSPNGFTMGSAGASLVTNSYIAGPSNFLGKPYIVNAGGVGCTNTCGYLPQPTYYIMCCDFPAAGGTVVFDANYGTWAGGSAPYQTVFLNSGKVGMVADEGGGVYPSVSVTNDCAVVVEVCFNGANTWAAINGGSPTVGGNGLVTNGQSGFSIGLNHSGTQFTSVRWNQILCFTNWDPRTSGGGLDRAQLVNYVKQRLSSGPTGF